MPHDEGSRAQFRFEQLENRHAPEIVELRWQSSDHTAQKNLLNWNQRDSKSIHFGVWLTEKDQPTERLVACLRLAILTSQKDFVDSTLFFDDSLVSYPVGLISRLATSPIAQKRGLHSSLHLRALKYAIENSLNHLVSVLALDSKLSRLYNSLGYQVIGQKVAPDWGIFNKGQDTQLFSLRKDQFSSAYNILSQKIAGEAFKWSQND